MTAKYPGASAKVVADTVAAPIEQQVNGAEGVEQLESESRDDGTYTLTLRVSRKADHQSALVAVQNRVSLAEPQLPEEVRRQGLTVDRKGVDRFPPLWIALTSPDGAHDALFLGNYAALKVRDEIARVAEVADARVVGGAGPDAVRVWLDPDKLAARKLTTEDVVASLRKQNAQVAVGQGEQPPTPAGQRTPLTVTTLGRHTDVDAVGEIVLRTIEGGQVIRLRDVGSPEPAARVGSGFANVNGKPAVLLAVHPTHDKNPADGVRKALAEIAAAAPRGLKVELVGDIAADRFPVAELRFSEGASIERRRDSTIRTGTTLARLGGAAGTFAYSEGAANVSTVVVKLSAQNPAGAADIRKALPGAGDIAVRVSDVYRGAAFPVRIALIDTGGAGDEKLRRWADAVAQRLGRDGTALDPAAEPGPPVAQLEIDVDRVKAEKLGVKVNDVARALGANLGAAHGNDFNKFGRTHRLTIRPEPKAAPDDLKKLEVRGRDGGRVELGAIVEIKTVKTPPTVFRVDLYPAVRIAAAAPDGKSVGEVASKCAEVADAVRKEMKLPDSFKVVNLCAAGSR